MTVEAAATSSIRLGSCVRDITPLRAVFLAGFGHRKNPATTIHSRLYLRAFVFEDLLSEKRAAVVVADIIGWDSKLAEKIESTCRDKFKTDCVILNATHTHSGPCVLSLHGVLHSSIDSDYLDFLKKQAVEAVGEACETFDTVRIRRSGIETSGLVVNRRLMTDQGIVARPNEKGSCDQELIVWKFERADGGVAAIWIHYACHPTILSGDDISSEFMGRVVEEVEEEWEGAVCAFFQGCAGDVRPHFVDGSGFFRGTTVNDLESFSRSMTISVKGAIASEGELVEHYNLEAGRRDVVLQAGERSGTAEMVDVSIRVTSLRLARNIGLIAYPGEPSIFYQSWIKSKCGGRILPLGYCNAFPGYLPTAAQIREGGYESELSCPLFGLPGPFDESLEGKLIREAEIAARKINQ